MRRGVTFAALFMAIGCGSSSNNKASLSPAELVTEFGAAGNAAFTWAMNVRVPYLVADTFRGARSVVFSTACVYPFADVNGRGAGEGTPALPPPGDYAAPGHLPLR